MRTDFTFVPSVFPAYSERHTRSVPVDGQDRQKTVLEAERCGFSGVVIDAISTLHEFVEVGISDFMIVGADERATMQQFSQRVATPLMQFLGHERPRARLVVSRDKPYWSAPGRA